MDFAAPDALGSLESASQAFLDEAAFGIVEMDRDGRVTRYNRWESQLSGLSPEGVRGRSFFTEVAPCTNNFMVAQRFVDEADLDASVDYVFTFKMRPTPVTLRLLARTGGERQYLLVARR